MNRDDETPADFVQRLVAGRDPIKVAAVMLVLLVPVLLAPVGLALLLVWLI